MRMSSNNEPRHPQAVRTVSLTPCDASPDLGTKTARSSSQLGEHHRSAALSPPCTIAAVVFLVCLALLGIPGSVCAGEQPAWLTKDRINRLFPEATYTRPPSGKPPAVPVYGAGGPMRYIRKYNNAPNPVKWIYRNPAHRITTDSDVTVH